MAMENTLGGLGGEEVFEMNFFVTKTKDKLFHVQNAVAGMLGQHHVHTLKGYREWKKGIASKAIIHFSGGKCDCGLKPGYIRSHDGIVTFNALFV